LARFFDKSKSSIAEEAYKEINTLALLLLLYMSLALT
jgi:hypothetical protein